ncbi:phosphoribosyltransferase [Streptomyces jeddahensis]|uniref:Putative phosphoribosyl transferasec n=1 Tax=Streptomyces jeddahensis TaxID=1716141 RepID=A0A177HV64_9ACTN|nr:phosphoribosyltransferase family protein [Streptomyces jeddahensis]OAH14550.1 putative phosphoribosyl transferasec [Streptomyces jeddahensis]
MRFHDRRHAGDDLGLRLLVWAADGELAGTLVLAVSRGGVPVAAEVARALHAPLDVLVAQEICAPGAPETVIGAIVADDPPLYDRRALAMLDLTEDRLGSYVARVRTELYRCEALYRSGRHAPDIEGRTVILVDDGLTPGVTMRAAVRHLRRRQPARLIVAVPVCAPSTAATLREESADLMCLHQAPESLYAADEWYEDFGQVTDQEVIDTLSRLSAELRERS